MKKILLSLATLASFGVANAQQMGDVFVNGGISYVRSNTETNTSGTSVSGPVNHRFQLAPSIGYQFDRNWGAGVRFDYDISREVTKSTATTSEIKKTNRGIGVGPFIRYTRNLSPMFFVYGQLNALYTSGKFRTETNGVGVDGDKNHGFAVNVMPAVGINLSRHIAVTGSFGSIGYATTKTEAPGTTNSSVSDHEFDATFGRQFTLGVQWNFNCGRHMGMRRSRREPMGETRRMDRYRDNDNDNDNDDAPAPPAPPRRRRMDRRDN